MALKQRFTAFVLAVLTVGAVYSCKKSSTVAAASTTVYLNIDSMAGTYVGTTSGDSIYSYVDAGGHFQQQVHSFSWPDTITVSSPDTASILVTSKFYTASFPYGDSLTYINVNANTGDIYNTTLLQVVNGSQITTFTDTFGNTDHLVLQVASGYLKSVNSSMTLLSH